MLLALLLRLCCVLMGRCGDVGADLMMPSLLPVTLQLFGTFRFGTSGWCSRRVPSSHASLCDLVRFPDPLRLAARSKPATATVAVGVFLEDGSCDGRGGRGGSVAGAPSG